MTEETARAVSEIVTMNEPNSGTAVAFLQMYQGKMNLARNDGKLTPARRRNIQKLWGDVLVPSNSCV